MKPVRIFLAIAMLAWLHRAEGQAAAPGEAMPAPAGPYPLNAAGWGPVAGGGRFVSRWAEDWTGMRAAGKAPALKAVPLGGKAFLTLSAEARLRYDTHVNGGLTRGNGFRQGLFRGIAGADLRVNPNLRLYGEIGTGQIEGRRRTAGANFQNDVSLQQLFVDVRGYAGSTLVGAMVGRQELADGPRQLLSVSDGPNIHRTWNGVRLYVHDRKLRLGAFDLRLTRPGRGSFDEEIQHDERLQGLNASMIVSPGPAGTNIYLDPFWLRTGRAGVDDRDTWGARLWGRRGDVTFDWTVARQSGEHLDREVGAWGVFLVQNVALSDRGWKPRLGGRIDAASGDFHQLYASSGYLGDGLFLSTRNLLLIAPGISASPTPSVSLSAEYAFARRWTESAPAYAGQMRAYPGTETVPGREIGGLLRVAGSWSVTGHLTLFFNYDRFTAGDVLERAQLPSGSFGYAGATLRY